jgi:hypothetical protein
MSRDGNFQQNGHFLNKSGDKLKRRRGRRLNQ